MLYDLTGDKSTLLQVPFFTKIFWHHTLGHNELMQDCDNSSALAMELPLSCTKASYYMKLK